MPEPANSVPLGIAGAGKAPAGDESAPDDLTDYVTPPPKKVIAVTVQYGKARMGAPLPYDLAGADEEP